MSNDTHNQAPNTHQASGIDEATAQQPRAFYRPKPDGNADPAGEAGWYLERERERRGLSLQTVSRAIGVHPQHVRAIELGMLENLPERDQALKMIGAYARFLGFDAQPLVEHFAACLPGTDTVRQEQAGSGGRIIPFPLIERLRDFSRTPGGMGASALAVVVLFGGLAWGFWPTGDAATPQHSKEMTAAANGAASDKAASAAQQATPVSDGAAEAADTRLAVQQLDTAATPDITAAGEATPDTTLAAEARNNDPIAALITRTISGLEEPQAQERKDDTVNNQQPIKPVRKAKALPLPPPPIPEERPARASSEVNAPASAQAGSAAAPISPEAVRPVGQVPASGIALRAAEQIWLRLEDDNGTPWYVGFLKAGQALPLPADKALRLSASDVHRLEWYVNGQRMGRLGKRGADFLSEPLNGLYKQSGLKAPGTKNTAG